MPSLNTRRAAGLAICAAALLLSSCASSGSGNQAHPTRSDDKPVISGEPAGYNTTDVTFARNMTALEEQGINLTLLVHDHSTDSGIATFAAKSEAALQLDTQVLKALRAQWKEDQDNQTPGGGGPSLTAHGMVDSATVTQLNTLYGPEFDTLWLKSMINLDQGAIEQANAEIANGKNVDAVSLAKQVVKTRQAEIGQMQEMLGS
ncbi:DUF305 domain-containing protein [Mycobacterium palustre]|uniref:DUF305 domain-containing protein n=1 Tax=Mycobacterium palustre TaxID=153971 RepID=A0A1X1ZIM6_9MYCO|nr:DUF305 domain-containing protein [Mycobacterium palustre]ORW23223.1 hypothetical protein AWC19_11685 [Mycobacterium palustre]